MAAVAYKATLVFAKGSPQSSNRTSYYCTASDIAAANYVFQDGNQDLVLPNIACYLVDVILTPAYGTDTTTSDVYANGKPTGDVVVNSANQSGTINRQFSVAPIGFLPGARIRFTQRA